MGSRCHPRTLLGCSSHCSWGGVFTFTSYGRFSLSKCRGLSRWTSPAFALPTHTAQDLRRFWGQLANVMWLQGRMSQLPWLVQRLSLGHRHVLVAGLLSSLFWSPAEGAFWPRRLLFKVHFKVRTIHSRLLGSEKARALTSAPMHSPSARTESHRWEEGGLAH